MALILGIDQSITNTGVALYDTEQPPSAMRFHSFRSKGRDDIEVVLSYRRQLARLIKDEMPDFTAFEAPLSHVQPQVKKIKDLAGEREVQTINARTALILNQIAGATIAVLDGRRRRFDMVRPVTWRKVFLGYTTKKDLAAAGHEGNWKRASMARCKQLNINARNQDQAESAGIAMWAAGCEAHKLLLERAS